MRLCHGHDESLTIPGADKSEEEQRLVDLGLVIWLILDHFQYVLLVVNQNLKPLKSAADTVVFKGW